MLCGVGTAIGPPAYATCVPSQSCCEAPVVATASNRHRYDGATFVRGTWCADGWWAYRVLLARDTAGNSHGKNKQQSSLSHEEIVASNSSATRGTIYIDLVCYQKRVVVDERRKGRCILVTCDVIVVFVTRCDASHQRSMIVPSQLES